uniref:T-cell receptor alpha/delta variable 13.0 n=1 Tax=Sinocyclocheilus anshuiensis TaxID=1608454 RepID=A0A671QAF6_9TELE
MIHKRAVFNQKLIETEPFLQGHIRGGDPRQLFQAFSPNELVSEGNTITLSCNYNGSAATDALHWYRQYPRSRPDFLFLVNEAAFKQPADPPIPGISARLNEEKNRVDLEITGTALTDSALYYCALQPTVTGNTHTLYKNETH